MSPFLFRPLNIWIDLWNVRTRSGEEADPGPGQAHGQPWRVRHAVTEIRDSELQMQWRRLTGRGIIFPLSYKNNKLCICKFCLEDSRKVWCAWDELFPGLTSKVSRGVLRSWRLIMGNLSDYNRCHDHWTWPGDLIIWVIIRIWPNAQSRLKVRRAVQFYSQSFWNFGDDNDKLCHRPHPS